MMPSAQYPPDKLSITSSTEIEEFGYVNVAIYIERAGRFRQIQAPQTVPSSLVYRRNQTLDFLSLRQQYYSGGGNIMTFFPQVDDTLHWATVYYENQLPPVPPHSVQTYTWDDALGGMIDSGSYYTFNQSLLGYIYRSQSNIFSFNASIPGSPIYSAVMDLSVPNAPLGIYYTDPTSLWTAIASTDYKCDFLIASLRNNTSSVPSHRLAWAPANNNDPIYMTSIMKYPAIEMVYSPISPTNFIPCRGSNPDFDLFHCVNGVWTSLSTINVQIITISHYVVINGSLFVEESIVFSDLQSTIIVSGCVQINGSISLTLTSADIEKILKGDTTTGELFRSTHCGLSNLNGKEVQLNQDGKKRCEKITAATKTTQDGKGLVAIMKIDKSSCNESGSNLWWIILVAVVCSVVLIAIIVLILVFTLNKEARNCIRPFSKRTPKQSETPK